MIVNTVTEAKAQLSKLIDRASNGEEIVIARAGKPAAMLVPYQPGHQKRVPGRMAGQIVIKDDFDSLPDDIANAFGMTK